MQQTSAKKKEQNKMWLSGEEDLRRIVQETEIWSYK